MYAYPNLTTIYNSSIADITSSNLSGITTLLPQSVLGILAYVIAAATYGNYQYLDYIAQNAVPVTATGEYLDAWANLRGVYRTAATAASGSVTLSGASGTTVPNGTIIQRADGFQYITTELVTLSGSPATIPIVAATVGSLGNAGSGIVLTLAQPIIGMVSAGSASGAIIGGADQETDSSLQTRMLAAYASPPQGGALSDYVEWALAVPGVTRAWAAAGGAGAGSVTVYTMMDVTEAIHDGFPQGTAGGATDETRITPATLDLLTVANYIYPLRPATALVYSVAPVASPVNVTFAYLSPNTESIQTSIASALSDLMVRVGSPLGSTLYLSDVYASIESVPGISEFSISAPASNTAINVGYIATVGDVTY